MESIELANKIINDSAILTSIRELRPDVLENINAEELNDRVNNFPYIPSQNIINRVSELYNEIPRYPNYLDEMIQLINDTDYLNSSKEIDLLVLLHFYPIFNKTILNEISPRSEYDYSNIKFKFTIIETAIANDLVDILKSRNYQFKILDLYLSCSYGSLKLFKYILNSLNQRDIDIHIAFANACKSGNIEMVKYIYLTYSSEIDIHYSNELPFKNAVESGNVELAEYIWNLGIKSGRRINHHIDNEKIFINALYSKNLKMVEFIWNLGGIDRQYGIDTPEDILFHNGSDIPTYIAIRNGDLQMAKHILNMGVWDYHKYFDILFIVACKSDNLELVKYLIAFNSKKNYRPFKINTETTDISAFKPEILDYISEKIILK